MLQSSCLVSRKITAPYICASCRLCLSSNASPSRALFPRSRNGQLRPYSDSTKPSSSTGQDEGTNVPPPTVSPIIKDNESDPKVLKKVLQALQRLESAYAAIDVRINDLGNAEPSEVDDLNGAAATSNKSSTEKNTAAERKAFTKSAEKRIGTRLKGVRGTLEILKSVLQSQQISLSDLTKSGGKQRSQNESSGTVTEQGCTPSNGAAAAARISKKKVKKKPSKAIASPEDLLESQTPVADIVAVDLPFTAALSTENPTQPVSPPKTWTSLAEKLKASFEGTSDTADIGSHDKVEESQQHLSSDLPSKPIFQKIYKKDSKSPGKTPRSGSSSPSKQSDIPKIKLNVQTVRARTLKLQPLELPDSPAVPSLSYGLDRVLFNPGVYHTQDPRSKVYNFDPYLTKIMPVNQFDFNALKKYVTSSKDKSLHKLASKYGKKYSGSTSSMTQILSHFHFLLSAWRPINPAHTSRAFEPEFETFTGISRAPAAAFLHLRDGVYSIDADKEYDTASILSMLGKSMEKLLTLPREGFERYRRENSAQITQEERDAEEAFHFTTMGDFLMRSQLDAFDKRLPGSGMFDLKTRAVVSIRMDAKGYKQGLGYEIRSRFGQWESFEREYYDMIRSAFLKYSLQVRMGRMDGIFVAFHNTQRIFGFQYVSLNEMDLALHGSEDRTVGDQEFMLSLHLLNKLLDKATERFPGRPIRLHVETRPSDKLPFMYVFAKPVDHDEIEAVQTANQATIAAYENEILGIVEKESGMEETDADDEELSNHEEYDASPEEIKQQQNTMQVFWDEMQDKVEEAIENDALGVNHIREVIQDALEQSGLLKARTSEEAEGHVDSLLEALIGEQGEHRGAETVTQDEHQDAGADTAMDIPSLDEHGSTHATLESDMPIIEEDAGSAHKNSESNPPILEGEATEALEDIAHPNSDNQVSRPATRSDDRSLKDLILEVTGRLDESSDADDNVSPPERDITSDVSKLKVFERLLSQLISESKLKESGNAGSVSDATSGDLEDHDGRSDPASSITPEAASKSALSKDETADSKSKTERKTKPDTTLKVTNNEILGMSLTVRNKINGKYVSRPEIADSKPSLQWTVEYAIEEIPTQRALSLYEAIQKRRKKFLQPNSQQEWHQMFGGKLKTMTNKGRKFRSEENRLAKDAPVHIVD